jgi:N-glycosylase/DNA lyase
MNSLIKEINLIQNEVKEEIKKRHEEFKYIGKNGTEEELFSELCFCIMTANWSAKGGIKAQKHIGAKNFVKLSLDEMKVKLKEVGHRFPNARAEYIVSNRWIIGSLKDLLKKDSKVARKYLAENVKGLGWKESSHFLRNVGKNDLAILDKHILKFMYNNKLIDEIPKSGWNEKKYIYHEKKLQELSDLTKIELGLLDIYLWYLIKNSVDK